MKAEEEKHDEEKVKISIIYYDCILTYFSSLRNFANLQDSSIVPYFSENSQDKVGSWYSNPGVGVVGSMGVTGGIGKYLKTRTSTSTDSSAANVARSDDSTKKRKVEEVSNVEFKNFSNW